MRKQSHPPPDPTCLSEREQQIVSLVGRGLRPLEIAARLSVNQRVFGVELRGILGKLGLSDPLELAIYARRHGL